MNILQVVQFLSPVHGGLSVGTYNLSNELAKRGHDVTLYTSDYKLSWEWVESLSKVKVFPFKTRSNLAEFYITPEMLNYMGEKIKSFDIIHLHDYRTFQNIIASRYAKKYNVPYVLQAHGSLPRIMEKHRLKWIYDVSFGYKSLRNASNVIALTQTEAQQYRDMGVPEEKIVIISNGIDLNQYTSLPPKGSFKKKFNISDDKKIILFLGRIHKIKGIDTLVRAYAYVVDKLGLDDGLLVIVGVDDGYLSELEHLLSRLKMTNEVLLTGPLYGKDKLEAYVDADVFVLSSLYETFPNVVLEAYACSKPVIASDVESISDIVMHGKTGLLFGVSNVEELAKAIEYMLMHPDDSKRMGHNGRNLVEEKFSINQVVNSHETLYQKVLEEKRIG